MLFFFEEVLAFDGVATEGSGSALRFVATSETVGCGGSDSAASGWDEVLAAAAAGVGIGGSDGSLWVNLLNTMKAKYRSSSMLAS